MKKATLLNLLLFLLFTFSTAHAQDRSINFKNKTWKAALKEAKSKKKIVFVDCYTAWCAPCKILDQNVFTKNDVADFYNENFIPLKMDMEKGEGPELANKYGVRAFPTLLYIDAEGNEIHRIIGAHNASTIISEGKAVIEGNETLSAYNARYKNGERDGSFIKKYIKMLEYAFQPQMQSVVASEFLENVEDDNFIERDVWDIVSKNIQDPLSPYFKKVFDHKDEFYKIAAKDSVDMYIDQTFQAKSRRYIWTRPMSENFNKEEFDAFIAYLKDIEWDNKAKYLSLLYTAEHWIKGEYGAMLDEMKMAVRYGIHNNYEKLQYIQPFIKQLSSVGEKDVINDAVNWVNNLIEDSKSDYEKTQYTNLKNELLERD